MKSNVKFRLHSNICPLMSNNLHSCLLSILCGFKHIFYRYNCKHNKKKSNTMYNTTRSSCTILHCTKVKIKIDANDENLKFHNFCATNSLQQKRQKKEKENSIMLQWLLIGMRKPVQYKLGSANPAGSRWNLSLAPNMENNFQY